MHLMAVACLIYGGCWWLNGEVWRLSAKTPLLNVQSEILEKCPYHVRDRHCLADLHAEQAVDRGLEGYRSRVRDEILLTLISPAGFSKDRLALDLHLYDDKRLDKYELWNHL
ncbi:hypothetical protein Nepgr_029924 [Nepenthes gracilis]|uniref:Uncharacterized protein n=1 Tax=Nepenthes gracilis TaxID=150966 RepID=A0AAD3Y616_NEPGR|nr:hypothetical protein Nepgr_029924 [Nepenthes gracilis]